VVRVSPDRLIAGSRGHRPVAKATGSGETFGERVRHAEGVSVQADLTLWVLLGVIIAGFLFLDLFVFHREAHAVSFREAATWSVVWIGLGLGFGGLVWLWLGPQAGGEYLAGYAIEKSLSMDNVFLFAMIFGYFLVPAKYQHRLLFYGVLGAIVFRFIFILAGAALLDAFHFTIYIFGAILLITGWRMARSDGHGVDPERNPVLFFVSRFIPVGKQYEGQRFFTIENGRRIATPLFAVLVVIETSDILFAIDSIPAIFAITSDPFIVFSSNAFAILGLRSLYFMLAGMIDRFAYLKLGLSALLIFAGFKILISDIYKMPAFVSLAAIVGILGVSIGYSLWKTRGVKPKDDPTAAGAAAH
jgi:tellurite resistance protein TerC